MASPFAPALGSDLGPAVPGISPWRPIATAPREDGELVQLWAEGARVAAWAWSDDRQRWERDGADGLHWSEGDEYGPTHWCPIAQPPAVRSAARTDAPHAIAAE